MKTLILIYAMLISSVAISQNYGQRWSEKDPPHYFYINGSFDPNMAFGIKDNPDTIEFDDRGFDYDIEAGVRVKHFGVYIFYGKFNEMSYQNYGAGVDYYFQILKDSNIGFYNPFNGYRVKIIHGIDLSIGVAYGGIIRNTNDNSMGNEIRSIATIWIGENIGLTMRFQLVQAGDLPNKDFRKEGSIGFTYKFDRKY